MFYVQNLGSTPARSSNSTTMLHLYRSTPQLKSLLPIDTTLHTFASSPLLQTSFSMIMCPLHFLYRTLYYNSQLYENIVAIFETAMHSTPMQISL